MREWVAWLLRTREGLAPGKAKLEAVRALMPLIGGSIHGLQGVVYVAVGLTGFVWSAALAVAVFTASFVLLRAGRPRTAMILAYAEVAVHVAAIEVVLGPGAGYLVYYFALVTVPFLVFKPNETLARVVCVLYPCLATPGLILWGKSHPPLVAIDPSVLNLFAVANGIGALFAVFVVVWYFQATSAWAEAEIERERQRSEQLLLNILPAPIAQRLKGGETVIADQFSSVTVLFADIVGFTSLSARISGPELIAMLNEVFSLFDGLAERHGLEKIKTIGDAYMVVGGLPEPRGDSADAMARMALDMREGLARSRAGAQGLEVRIGIHTGPVVAGVIGVKKFAYDLWGDTVNTASRMESHGEPNRVHVSDATRDALGDRFRLEDRGVIAIKGKGEMHTWFLESVA